MRAMPPRIARPCTLLPAVIALFGCAKTEERSPAAPAAVATHTARLEGATPSADAGAPTYGVFAETWLPVKMRDGTTLVADVYRPRAEGKFPVLLERTPYDRTFEADTGVKWATRGYVVVVQDVRGRFNSEGEWYPFKHEIEDGFDTVEWAAALPYSNGKVGMFGGSYVGATQLLAAIAQPPHLTTIVPVITASDYHDGWVYQGGALE
jgi:predicted acyl esterase